MNQATPQISEIVDGMRAAIDDFVNDDLSISGVAWELKSRIAALREVANHAWADELKSIWNQLELVNAVFLESRRSELAPSGRKEALEVLSELRAALVQY
jgi:uncharacterized small protein (DUF1192 family)